MNEMDENLIKTYSSGMSILKISKRFGIPYKYVSNLINSLGIRKPLGHGARKYTSNENYFSKIDSPEKAYWLGFIYADGCVTKQNSLSIILHKKDTEHLMKLKDSLNATNPIEERVEKIKNKNGEIVRLQECSKLRISSTKITKDLINAGCFRNKSKILKYPNPDIIPKELEAHFIAGYFDGDGCVYIYLDKKNKRKYGLNITGTCSVIEGIKLFLDTMNIKSKIRNHKTEGIAVLESYSIYDIRKFDNTIFSDRSLPYLTRKQEKFKEFAFTSQKDRKIALIDKIKDYLATNASITLVGICELLKVKREKAYSLTGLLQKQRMIKRVDENKLIAKYGIYK